MGGLVLRFISLFLGLLLVLFTIELLRPVHYGIVLPWTALLASISAWVVGVFDPEVISYGKVLQHSVSGIGVSIEPGCNGIEACIILTAAVLAYPSDWKMKLAGVVLGFVAIQAVNVLRVITLFYLAAWDREVFEFAHLYLWQALIMLDVVVVWLIWVRQVARREAGRHVATA